MCANGVNSSEIVEIMLISKKSGLVTRAAVMVTAWYPCLSAHPNMLECVRLHVRFSFQERGGCNIHGNSWSVRVPVPASFTRNSYSLQGSPNDTGPPFFDRNTSRSSMFMGEANLSQKFSGASQLQPRKFSEKTTLNCNAWRRTKDKSPIGCPIQHHHFHLTTVTLGISL